MQAAAARQFVTRPDSDMLLLAVELDRVTLSEAIPTYHVGSSYLLPLGELSRQLTIAIDVDPERGSATGFIIRTDRTFRLDADQRSVTSSGVTSTFAASDVEVHEDDIYVEAKLLQTWLPVSFSIDPFASRIIVAARERLPLQSRRERELRIAGALARGMAPEEGYPRIATPYAWWDGPFVDQTLTLSSSRAGRQLQFTTYATGDLLRSQFELYLAGTQHDPTRELRGTLGRADPGGGLLGPMHARQILAGDVLVPGDDLVIGGGSGWGALVSSYPLVRQSQFDSHTFRGILPAGWEVELYRDEGLIGYQQARPDGLYEFADIPLLFGPNMFRLVSYGPHGEKREEIYPFNVGESLAPAGKSYYRVSGSQDSLMQRRAVVEYERGLRENVSASATAAWADVIQGSGRFARLGASGFWRWLFAHGDVGVKDGGGNVERLLAQSRVGSTSILLQQIWAHDFSSEVVRSSYGELTEDTRLRLDSLIRIGTRAAVTISADAHREAIAGAGSIYDVTNRLAFDVAGTSLSNALTGTFFSGSRAATGTFRGQFLASRHFGIFAMRGEVGYAISPGRRIDNISLIGETFRFPGYLVQAGVNGSGNVAATALLVNVNRLEGRFGAGIGASYSRSQGAAISVNLFAGLARDPRTGRWMSRARTAASVGAASPLVFLDTNGNGVLDPDEKPLPGVGFFLDRNSVTAVTGPNGSALIASIPPFQSHSLAVSTSTLEDPAWVPEQKGIEFVARPGKTQLVDFPIAITGMIGGTAYVGTGKGAASGVHLQLVSTDGEVVAETRSAYDGYYELTKVRPGQYALRIAPDQAGRIEIVSRPSRALRIETNGTEIDGFDITVARIAAPATPAVPASHSVSGRLVLCEGDVHKPLAGATITLFDALFAATAQTGADGSFSFDGVPNGSYLVLIDTAPQTASPPPRQLLAVSGEVADYEIAIGCKP